jgi:hypothetical protein
VQIAIAIPSLSALEKDADLPPRFNEADRKFLEIFFTQFANLSAWVGIVNIEERNPINVNDTTIVIIIGILWNNFRSS